MLRNPVFHAIAGIMILLALLAFIFRGTFPGRMPTPAPVAPNVGH
jgi:hypothetical protein